MISSPATSAIEQAPPARGLSEAKPSRIARLELVDPHQDGRWDAWVRSHPDATVFHTSAWARVLSGPYGHKPVYTAILRDDDPLALIPCMDVRSPLTGARGVCLPFSDACGPLTFTPDVPRGLLDGWWRLVRERRWKYVEVRGSGLFHPSGQPVVCYYGHSLDLRPGLPAIFAGLKSSLRGHLRKAERNELKTRISHEHGALSEFYRLHVRTRRKLGVPVQSFAFFQKIHEELISRNFGFLVIVKRGELPIAGTMFLRVGTRALYKFSASDERFRELCAGHLALWSGIQHLTETGAETLELGRTSADNDGLRNFKLTWGTKEEEVAYWRWNADGHTVAPENGKASRLKHAMFRRLPPGIDRWAGKLIYPHLD